MRIRQHVNPLKSDFFRLSPDPIVAREHRVIEVELGSAEAWFLFDRAEREPDTLFVGIEIRRELVEKVEEDCRVRNIANVRSVFANISVDLPRLFQPGQVRRFFLNFPDPWWKSKQRKRRVVSGTLVDQIARYLQPGGEFFVYTDIFDIALDAMLELEMRAPNTFQNIREPWRFLRSSAFSARSRRERQCEMTDTKIWRLGYRRMETPASMKPKAGTPRVP